MRFFRTLYSLKLAAILLTLLTVLVVIGGLLPQGGQEQMYYRILPLPVAGLLLFLGLDHTFSSIPFIVVAGVFLLNLTACSVRRFAGQIKRQRGVRSFGPDILHLGILVLALGGVISGVARQEVRFTLVPHEERTITEGYRIGLDSFEYRTYSDGRPKDWISTVTIFRNGEKVRQEAEIEVNKPLRLGGYSLYQVYHERRPVARFTGEEGEDRWLIAGYGMEINGGVLRFAAVAGESGPYKEGLFILQEGNERQQLVFTVGDTFRGLELKTLRNTDVSGLMAVRDRGYLIVLIGGILAAAGLAVTYTEKIVRIRKEV